MVNQNLLKDASEFWIEYQMVLDENKALLKENRILNSNIKIGDYTLSGKNVLSIYDLYNLIIKNLKVKRIIIKIHPSLVYFFAKLLCFFSLNKFCFEEKVLRLTEDRNYSSQNAVNDFGYNPLPFQYYLNDEINHYLSSK